MKRKLDEQTAIKVMTDINSGLKTSIICKKYKDYDLKPHDIYNMIYNDHYKELGKLLKDE